MIKSSKIVLLTLAFVLVVSAPFAGADAGHILISQVQITGGTGHTTDDFVELYNPTNSDIDLKGMRLVKRAKTSTSDTLIKSWTDSTLIKAHSYYLWSNSDFSGIAVQPDVTTSGQLANDNGVAIRNGPNDTGEMIDSLAWGQANNGLGEGSFPENPGVNQSLERKLVSEDTGDNFTDFFVTDSNPHNSRSPINVVSTPIPTETPAPTPTPVVTVSPTQLATPTPTPSTTQKPTSKPSSPPVISSSPTLPSNTPLIPSINPTAKTQTQPQVKKETPVVTKTSIQTNLTQLNNTSSSDILLTSDVSDGGHFNTWITVFGMGVASLGFYMLKLFRK